MNKLILQKVIITPVWTVLGESGVVLGEVSPNTPIILYAGKCPADLCTFLESASKKVPQDQIDAVASLKVME